MDTKTAQVRQLCAERKIRIEPRGLGHRLRGPGVDMTVRHLAEVLPRDLEPFQPKQRED
jgi:hypothetical protein